MNGKKTVKWLIVLAVVLLAAHAGAEETPVLTTKKDKISYVTGVDMARHLKRQGIELDIELVIRGVRDAFAGEKLLVTDQEQHAIINALQAEVRKKEIEKRHARAKAGADNRKEGEAFLAGNKEKEGVVILPSGLQYKILKAGDGRKPTDADTVECHYRGTLIDGTEFDSSYTRGKPASLAVKEVIPGWREALKLMPVGSKWQLFIPPELAYGKKGSGRLIGPNATLIFEVELLAIK
jgi:FKBP-type peptidyl-prolyl cis-trans isomerase FklB